MYIGCMSLIFCWMFICTIYVSTTDKILYSLLDIRFEILMKNFIYQYYSKFGFHVALQCYIITCRWFHYDTSHMNACTTKLQAKVLSCYMIFVKMLWQCWGQDALKLPQWLLVRWFTAGLHSTSQVLWTAVNSRQCFCNSMQPSS